MHRLPTATRPPISEHARLEAVFLPGDPARNGSVAFWDPEGGPLPATSSGVATTLTVALGADRTLAVRALCLPVREALPLLTRGRAAEGASESVAFWGAAGLLALQLVARGLLLPGLSATAQDAWRAGPLTAEDLARVRALAAAMPPAAHAVPLAGEDGAPPELPEPEKLLRDFLDAVADTLPRTPAAPSLAGGPAFAADAPRRMPELRGWAAEVAAGHDAGVRLSLRVDVAGLDDGSVTGAEAGPTFRLVLQVHGVSDPGLVADAAALWASDGAAARAFGPRARTDALLGLRRAVRAWAPLAPLLSAAVPDAVDVDDEEIAGLLGPAARALAAAGVQVHWPARLSGRLTARAVIGSPEDDRGAERDSGPYPGPAAGGGLPSLLGAGTPLMFEWRFALGDQGLTREELDRLAEAKRPVVRLRDRWVLVDPEEVRRVRTAGRRVTPVDALTAALTGSTEADGRLVPVSVTGRLARLRDRLSEAGSGDGASRPQPRALSATLRDYQLRGLNWLDTMTSLGLGACLADDMGLGKTITLIALHLRRQEDAATTGPTLVVCPTSLMGNWQREIERFAPGTAVRRFHGPSRSPQDLAGDGFVLTTYGTMRLDAARLADTAWGLVVADEAQHVKNPRAATAKALRTIGAGARVALTGTPVENDLTELWAILDWATPGLLGRLGTFRRLYATAVEGGRDPAAAERLGALVRPFLLRRRKSDPGIAPELPPKTETDHAVSLTAEQAGLYEAVVRETLAEIARADGFERRGLVVRLLTSLKQICNHPAQYLKEDGPRIADRSGKVELLDELLDTILAEDASVLVFTQYVAMARLLERHLAGRGVATQFLHGGTPVARREEMVHRFQRGGAPVFLLSLKAAGTGLNLTRAGHVVHFDRWWNPAVEAQATDRAHRIGQTRPVQVHRIIAEGTVEDRIAGLLARKQDLADAVLGSGETALTELTDAELTDLVTLRGGSR
ncbi:DEAD/DEAH box helicase [Streptomyces sp. NBC_00102]|uniref:DEAD/DEAH box helicase n=1 Tax=Streptomyces sp. NBC_00102 TaxID=2975652 RepID=UPI00224E637C|nr:DEAD/DEAH box helicase [Streptomyces sp. NBC_00102]MCX5401888.1 DEAD/DEAH box helicase [Streptomyces sp. NBC_00102]